MRENNAQGLSNFPPKCSFFVLPQGNMAIIAGELSMPCSPARLLSEPDVIPPVKYLFESDPELSKQENIKVPYEDSLQMKVDEDEFIDIVICEDKTGDHSDDTIDGGYITGKSSPDPEFCQEIQDGYTKFNDDHEFCITEKSAPCLDSCMERDGPIRDCSPNIIVTAPNASEDIVETPLPPKVVSGSLKRKSEMKEFKIPLKKLRVTTNCVNKKLELEEDEYIFCSKCDKLQIGACSIHSALQWMKESSNVVMSEGLTKARATIPKNMELKSSSIPDAGLGIFALERFESDVVFGPYWGEKIDVANVTPNMDQGYMWDIIERGRVTHVVDARDESHSNWLRFVNCARNEDEQNLVAFQYRGDIYYRAYKVIEPGMELLVWYGDRYACDLDILNKEKKPADGPVQCQKCFMICSGPSSLASHNKFRCQMSSEHHLWRCMHCDRSFKTPSSLHFHKNIHKGIKPFSCKLCGAVFSFPASRKRHYAQQHGQWEALSCKPCDKVFANKNALEAHEKNHHNQGDYKCQTCGQCFTSGISLSNHKRAHERSEAQNFCSICKKRFAHSSTLAKHLREKHPRVKIYRCGKCGKFCSDKRRLALHFAVKHSTKHGNRFFSSDDRQAGPLRGNSSVKQKGAVKCEFCLKAFPTLALMNRHRAAHYRTKNPTLPVATYDHHAVPSSESRDINGHSSKDLKCKMGNFACNICGKSFRKKLSLNAHKASHSRTRRLALSAATYVQPAVPSSESRDINGHNGKTLKRKMGKFACNVCGKSFQKKPSLNAHKSHHSFKRRTSALSDSRSGIHSRKCIRTLGCNGHNSKDLRKCKMGKFACNVCGKSFQKKLSLKVHRASHSRTRHPTLPAATHVQPTVPSSESRDINGHNGKTLKRKMGKFACNVCGKSFQKKSSLNAHKSHHSFKRRTSPLSDSRSNIHSRKCIRTFSCNKCTKSFLTERSLRSHKTHHSRFNNTSPDPAIEEQNGVRGLNTRKEHLLTSSLLRKQSNASTSPTSKPRVFICGVCGKKFLDKKNLHRHKGHHSRGSSILNPKLSNTYECSTCLEFFHSRSSLKCHKNRLHEAVDPASFVCPFCDLRFSSREDLMMHKQDLHSTADPFTCIRCDGRFGTKRTRDRHVCPGKENRDKETSVKQKKTVESKPALDSGRQETHECKTCLQTFPSTRSLSNHKRSHAGVTSPCVCSICHKGLSSKRSLLRHKQSQHSSTNLLVENKLRSIGEGIKHNSNSEVNTCCKTTERFRTAEALSGTRDCIEHSASKQGVGQSSEKTASPPKKTQPSRNNEQSLEPNGEGTVGLWNCLYCEKQFKSDSVLRRHSREQHGTTKWMEYEKEAARSFKCPYFVEEFKSLSGKHQHVKEKHHTCNYPPFSSGSQNTRPHFGPYSKEYPAKMPFSWDTSPPMNSSETATKGAFKCQYCVKGFFKASSRYKHIVIVHSGRFGTKRTHDRHVCPGEKNRDKETSLKQKTTVESKPALDSGRQETHECKTCLQTFPSTRSLSNHRRSHAGVTSPYVCSICHKGLSSKRSLLRHKQSQHSSSNRFVEDKLRSIGEGIKHNSNSEMSTCCKTTERFRTAEALSGTRDCIQLRASKQGDEESSQKTTSPPKKTQPSRNKEQSLEPNGEGTVGLWNCLYCEKQFKSDSGLRRHSREKHRRKKWKEYEKEAARPFKRSYCDEEFKSPTGKQMMSPAEEMGSKSSDQSLELENAIGQTVESDVPFGCFRPGSTSASQPSTKLKAFQCDYCSKRFHTCSVMYKHYLLVHSRFGNLGEHDFFGPMACPTKKPSHPPVPIPTGTINPKDSDLVSQGYAGGLGHSPLHVNFTDIVSTSEEDMGSFACRICAKLFQTKTDWAAHVNDEHNGVEPVPCGICNPSRPVLRPISVPFQNNSVRLPRKRGVTCREINNDKQVCAKNMATPNHVVCLPTMPAITNTLQCDICFLFFSRKDCVSRHKKSKHCDDTPFQCNNCGYASKRNDYMVYHKCDKKLR